MPYTWMSQVTHMNEPHDSFICVTWVIHTCAMTTFKSMTGVIHTCAMTHPIISLCVITPSHPQRVARDREWLLDEPCHTHKRDVSHIWISHVTLSPTAGTSPQKMTSGRVMAHMWMNSVTHMDESSHTRTHSGRFATENNFWMSHGTHEWVKSHTWMRHPKLSPAAGASP